MMDPASLFICVLLSLGYLVDSSSAITCDECRALYGCPYCRRVFGNKLPGCCEDETCTERCAREECGVTLRPYTCSEDMDCYEPMICKDGIKCVYPDGYTHPANGLSSTVVVPPPKLVSANESDSTRTATLKTLVAMITSQDESVKRSVVEVRNDSDQYCICFNHLNH